MAFLKNPSLLKQLEGPLLRLVAGLHEVLQRLLAERMLALGNDAALVLHQVLLGQAAGRVASRAVPHLRLGADGGHGTTLHHGHRLRGRAGTTLHHGHRLCGRAGTTHHVILTASATSAPTTHHIITLCSPPTASAPTTAHHR